MSEEKGNMELWASVEKTPKEIIKELEADEKGFKAKTIDAINRVKIATEKMGIYGGKWGLRNIVHSEIRVNNACLLGRVEAEFFAHWRGVDYAFQVGASGVISMIKDKQFILEASYVQSLETKARNKGLSLLGFNSDIYSDEELVKTGLDEEAALENMDLLPMGVENSEGEE